MRGAGGCDIAQLVDTRWHEHIRPHNPRLRLIYRTMLLSTSRNSVDLHREKERTKEKLCENATGFVSVSLFKLSLAV